jgi:hypothetical protein
MSRRDIIEELFKPSRRRGYPRRKIVLKGIDDVIMFDLADFQSLAKENSGHRYLLVGINGFTKQGYAKPIKDKKAATVANAAEQILDESGVNFKLCNSDEGSEFKGQFQTLLKDRNIRYYNTYSEIKSSIVER